MPYISYPRQANRTSFPQVFVFSSMHVSGEQLDQYTGVAATLRFPMPEVLQEEEESEEESEVLNAPRMGGDDFDSF